MNTLPVIILFYFTLFNVTYSFLSFPQEHTGRVFRLQFDEFQIVSSSHDDTILIWDFLNYTETSSNNNQQAPSNHLTLQPSFSSNAMNDPPEHYD